MPLVDRRDTDCSGRSLRLHDHSAAAARSARNGGGVIRVLRPDLAGATFCQRKYPTSRKTAAGSSLPAAVIAVAEYARGWFGSARAYRSASGPSLKERRRNAMSFSASVLPRSFTRRLRSYRVPRMLGRLRFKSIRPLRIRMDGSRSNFEGPLGLYCRAWCNGFGESLPADVGLVPEGHHLDSVIQNSVH
jgi:hypothetical protein